MSRHSSLLLTFGYVSLISLAAEAACLADTLTLTDGTIIKNCYVRDEGVRIGVWTALDQVGRPPQLYPRSQVKEFKVERGADWDRRPDRPDLSVTFIEITPRLAGLHGRVQYDELGRPWIGGDSKLLVDLGEQKYTNPEGAVEKLKLQYEPGEELTLVAHVKNLGFADARPFRVQWFVEPAPPGSAPGAWPVAVHVPAGKPLAEMECGRALRPMEEETFTCKWRWDGPERLVTVRIVTDQEEIATINNQATDALWAWPYTFVVSQGRVAAWHENRTAYGTFSFEDFYRWHVDIMNLLFAASVFPSSPGGIRARVRLDRIIYADQVRDNEPVIDGKKQSLFAADGIRYDQGGWSWNDDPKELESGKWAQTDPQWRNQTEWSLPHELGHQLGLVDHYNIDYAGHEFHRWPDNGAKVTHFQRYPEQMMHSHGPQVYGEADAGYLNLTVDKPRGHFGDYYFAIPHETFLHITDINGVGLPGAKVAVFQRGVVVDPRAPRGEDAGVEYFGVVEDGNFDHPVSKEPVIAGETDEHGDLLLPNRPVAEVRTLNGFHRRPNPFGNLNVVGQRGLLLVRVTKDDRPPCYFWLEAHDFIVDWLRGFRGEHLVTLRTTYGSIDSPPPPASVKVDPVDEHHVRVTWSPPAGLLERQYLHKVIGYRVYRRVGDDGLNDRPWFAVATLTSEMREFVVDLRQFPQDVYWYKPEGAKRATERVGVTALGPCSVESELVGVVYPDR